MRGVIRVVIINTVFLVMFSILQQDGAQKNEGSTKASVKTKHRIRGWKMQDREKRSSGSTYPGTAVPGPAVLSAVA